MTEVQTCIVCNKIIVKGAIALCKDCKSCTHSELQTKLELLRIWLKNQRPS